MAGENVVWYCIASLHCSCTDLIQQNIQLANYVLVSLFFFLSFSLMQDSFLDLTVSVLFWYNSHLSPLLTNCRCDCDSSFGFRCKLHFWYPFDLDYICRFKYLQNKIKWKEFHSDSFLFLLSVLQDACRCRSYGDFFSSILHFCCIWFLYRWWFPYCFIQMYIGGDLQMPVLLEYFSILKFLDAFMLSSACLFSTFISVSYFSSLDFMKIGLFLT